MLKHLRMKFEREVKSERRKNCYGQACSSLEFPCVKKISAVIQHCTSVQSWFINCLKTCNLVPL